jgi:hypothetical protein
MSDPEDDPPDDSTDVPQLAATLCSVAKWTFLVLGVVGLGYRLLLSRLFPGFPTKLQCANTTVIGLHAPSVLATIPAVVFWGGFAFIVVGTGVVIGLTVRRHRNGASTGTDTNLLLYLCAAVLGVGLIGALLLAGVSHQCDVMPAAGADMAEVGDDVRYATGMPITGPQDLQELLQSICTGTDSVVRTTAYYVPYLWIPIGFALLVLSEFAVYLPSDWKQRYDTYRWVVVGFALFLPIGTFAWFLSLALVDLGSVTAVYTV